jgi:hypothetical protein
MTVFYCLIFETLQPGEPGPHIYIPQAQGGPVILAPIPALGSLSVTSYSQGTFYVP